MNFHRILPSLILLLLPLLASATSFFDLISNGTDKAVDLRIEVAMDSILNKTAAGLEASIVFTDNTGLLRSWETDLEVRGKFRRQRCEFPPLKLNFSKKALAALGLEIWDKYKLVSTCSADPISKNLVLKEYLAYRAYNELTANSFRVQRLSITFVDINGNYPDRTEEGFIIEDTDEMAARLGGKEVENPIGQPAEAYDPHAEVTHALVQYLLSNGDFSMPLARNMKAVEMPGGQLVPVGYDFDFSGWVGAPYASPTSEIGQQSIYQRIYQGYAQSDEVMREVALSFKSKRRQVMGLIAKFSYLPSEDLAVVHRFASRFFNDLNKKSNNDALPLYDQLRGAVAEMIPAGADAKSFRLMGR
jgi:hypothetical protein